MTTMARSGQAAPAGAGRLERRVRRHCCTPELARTLERTCHRIQGTSQRLPLPMPHTERR